MLRPKDVLRIDHFTFPGPFELPIRILNLVLKVGQLNVQPIGALCTIVKLKC